MATDYKSGRKPRTGAKTGSYQRQGDDRRPSDRGGADRGGYGQKSFSRGPRKDFAPRGEGTEGFGYKGPRKPRPEGDRGSYSQPRGTWQEKDGKSFAGRSFARKPRPDFAGAGEERESREGRSRPYSTAPRAGRTSGGWEDRGERKPFAAKSYNRKPRPDFENSGENREGRSRPYSDAPRGGKPRAYGPRPERDADFQPKTPSARFDARREVRRDRKTTDERSAYLAQQDGWLIGYHAVVAALQTGRRSVRSVWLMGEAKGALAAVLAEHPEWPVELKAKPDFDAQFGDMVHQGVAALVGNLPQPSLPELLANKPQVLVALDHVTDPHNLGAIVRSCAAFGAGGVITTEDRAAGLTPTAAKAAAGALETVPVVSVVNLVQTIKMLQESGYTVVGMAGEAEADLENPLFTKAAKGKICIVVGSEGEGLRRLTRETCDALVKIAILPAVESLNVSVATGVVLAAASSHKNA